MSETIINGIDVSECEHHYTNTVNGIIYNGCAINNSNYFEILAKYVLAKTKEVLNDRD